MDRFILSNIKNYDIEVFSMIEESKKMLQKAWDIPIQEVVNISIDNVISQMISIFKNVRTIYVLGIVAKKAFVTIKNLHKIQINQDAKEEVKYYFNESVKLLKKILQSILFAYDFALYCGIINFENASDITYALLVQSKNAIL